MKTLYTKLSLVLILFLISAAAFAQNVIVDTKKNYPGIKKNRSQQRLVDGHL